MKHFFIVGAFLALCLTSCKNESKWKTTQYYPSGEVLVSREYIVDNADTVYIYEKVFYQDGVIKVEGALKEDKREGEWKSFYTDGKPWSITEFQNGELDGLTKTFYMNGQLRYDGYYKVGDKVGNWHWYDSTGILNKEVDFDVEGNN